MRTAHRRPVTGIPGTGVIEAQVYDEAFFIAFEATCPPCSPGATGCAPELVRADLDAAYAGWRRSLRPSAALWRRRTTFRAVGALFADRLVFSCAP
jgi:hypothetical protein